MKISCRVSGSELKQESGIDRVTHLNLTAEDSEEEEMLANILGELTNEMDIEVENIRAEKSAALRRGR